nr:glutamate racemase [Nanchangia anserum]
MPHEQILYVGDTAHTPYGDKPLAQVRTYALQIMDDLVDSGVKMIVIACNTASSAVLHDARERYTDSRGIPVVEVVVPAAHAALRATTNHRIGVIGTVATVTSGVYQDTLSVVPGVEVYANACPRFVEFAEAGITTGDDLLAVARSYLEPLIAHDIDTLVLGCTHYPLLAGAISYVCGDGVTLVSSSSTTARRAYAELARADLMRDPRLDPPVHRFTATGPADRFLALAHRILGPNVEGLDPVTT